MGKVKTILHFRYMNILCVSHHSSSRCTRELITLFLTNHHPTDFSLSRYLKDSSNPTSKTSFDTLKGKIFINFLSISHRFVGISFRTPFFSLNNYYDGESKTLTIKVGLVLNGTYEPLNYKNTETLVIELHNYFDKVSDKT